MEALRSALPPLLGGGALLIVLVCFRRPLRALLRLIPRALAGFCVLSALGRMGLALGLAANGFNALMLGLLGAPGFGLLLMVRWVLLA